MTTEHHHRHISKKKKALYIVTGLAALVLVAAATIYFTRSWPVAMVGGNLVTTKELETSILIAKRLDPAPDKEKIFEQLIKIKQESLLLKKLRIDPSNAFADELNFYKTGNEGYKKLLTDYFSGSEQIFVKYVVEPETFDALLRVKYNSNFGANNDTYNKASNILAKLSEGQTFEDLAKQYSDDKVSGQLGGDIGFVTLNQILPELKEVVETAALGQVRKEIAVSRQGYHILFPVEISLIDNQKVWHIKQILIQTAGYEGWLQTQLKTIGVYKF